MRRGTGRLKSLPHILLLLLLAIPAVAQVQSIKFHYGDDPRWADPDFDDSGWIDAGSNIDIYAHLLDTFTWARMKVRVPDPALRPVIGTTAMVVQIFVEGRMVGSSGSPPPNFEDAPTSYRTWPIPSEFSDPGRIITVAVRMWKVPGLDLRRLNTRALSTQYLVFVHPAGETPIYEQLQKVNFLGQSWALAIMLALLIFLLTAGRVQWSENEFRLLLGYVLLVLGIHITFVCGWLFPWGNRAFVSTAIFIGSASALQLELIAWIAGVRRAWWLRAAQSLLLLLASAIACAHSLNEAPWWLPVVARPYNFGYVLSLVTIAAILCIQKSAGFAKRLVPLSLAIAAVGNLGTRILPSLGLPGGFQIGGVYFSALVTGNILFAVILVAIRLQRLKQAGEVAVALQAQFEAARSVQEMLLTGTALQTPGYLIDPVYVPAGEVGGDFFRILPAPDNCTLLVVGDVSGKGLKAAMMVSVVVGALLNRRSNDPADVLTELNNAMHGQMEGGFITCCAALLMPDGELKISNAGHVAPYRNSSEIELPAELPLGIVPQTEYQTATLQLPPGGQLTFLSDGVVEAANAKGELFGFDRSREMSGKTAREIANAARAFGQNDDITVVTVRRIG